MSLSVDRLMLEATEKWRGWVDKIPPIEFPAGWGIRMCPPFMGALVRFHVFANNQSVSVYLDVDDSLGYCGSPYWEVYPVNENNERVLIDDVAGLIALIAEGCGLNPQQLNAPDVIEQQGGAPNDLPRPE